MFRCFEYIKVSVMSFLLPHTAIG